MSEMQSEIEALLERVRMHEQRSRKRVFRYSIFPIIIGTMSLIMAFYVFTQKSRNITNTENQATEATAENTTSQSQLEKLQGEYNQLQQQYNTILAENTQYKQSYEGSQSQLAQAQSQVSTFQKTTLPPDATSTSPADSSSDLQLQVKVISALNQDLRQKLADTQKLLEQAKQKLTDNTHSPTAANPTLSPEEPKKETTSIPSTDEKEASGPS
jgi:peptidoglycan hydrolase CwlO-like protein